MKVLSDPLYRKSFIIMISAFVSGVINYLFNPLAARLLNPAQYGELLTMLAVVNVVAIPATTSATVTTQFVSRYLALGDEDALGGFIVKMYRSIALVSGAFIAVFVVLIPIMMRFFHFSSSAPLLLLNIIILGALIYPIAQGIIQGRQQFIRLSVINVTGSVLRAISVIVAMVLGFQLTGIIGLLGVGSLVLLYIAFRWTRTKRPRTKVVNFSTNRLIRQGVYALLANVGLAIFLNIDVLITKRFLSPDLAGQYGIVSLLGKAIYFLGGSLALVLFPMVLSRHAKNESSTSIITKALVAISLITVGAVAIFMIFGPFVVRTLFGSRYLGFTSVLWQTGVVFGLYSVIHILITFFLATSSKWFIAPLLGGCLVIPLAFAFGPHSVQFLLYVMMATFTEVALLLLLQLKNVKIPARPDPSLTSIEPIL